MTIVDNTVDFTIENTSNERVTNNTMRHEYRVLTDDEKDKINKIKDLGLEFITSCDKFGSSRQREMSLAKTNMEQAVMWAVKAITK